jgi:hypothetical protein
MQPGRFAPTGRGLRPVDVAATVFVHFRQQFAQLAFGAQSDFRGIVLRLEAQSSLPSVDARGFGEVVDGFGVVNAADLGEQPSRGFEAGEWR